MRLDESMKRPPDLFISHASDDKERIPGSWSQGFERCQVIVPRIQMCTCDMLCECRTDQTPTLSLGLRQTF
jgi:hypothetical protein